MKGNINMFQNETFTEKKNLLYGTSVLILSEYLD